MTITSRIQDWAASRTRRKLQQERAQGFAWVLGEWFGSGRTADDMEELYNSYLWQGDVGTAFDDGVRDGIKMIRDYQVFMFKQSLDSEFKVVPIETGDLPTMEEIKHSAMMRALDPTDKLTYQQAMDFIYDVDDDAHMRGF